MRRMPAGLWRWPKNWLRNKTKLKNTRWDILAFGVVAVDDLVYVDQYPLPDSKMPVLKMIRQGGGLAGTESRGVHQGIYQAGGQRESGEAGARGGVVALHQSAGGATGAPGQAAGR